MNLYIETENGVTKNHPAYEDNLIQAFGSVPEHWEPFIRVQRPEPTLYQTFDNPESVYSKVNGVWTDIWSLRDMTAEEKIAKQQIEKNRWASFPDRDNFVAWGFDEDICMYRPPIPRPTEGKVFWQGTTLTWVARPEYPTDGKMYKLDFASATWVEVVV
jgi:hypothetical protein